MSRFAKLFAANAIAASGLGAAALFLSSTASAEPLVPPAVPSVPGLSMIQQLAADPSMVGGAVLQTAATALNGASSLVGAGPAALPVSPIGAVPASPVGGLPVSPVGAVPASPVGGLPVSPIQGVPAAPAAQMPATAPLGVESLAPLLSQLGVPAALNALTPSAIPAAVPAAPVAPLPSPAMPLSALSFLP